MIDRLKRKRGEYCPIKGHERVYFQIWDMFACLECDAWLSDQCQCPPSAECVYNRSRAPLDPSKAINRGAKWERA